MMKFHKPGRLRLVGGAAAIATLGGLSLAFGSAPVAAQQQAFPPTSTPPQAAPQEPRHEDRVIVRTIRTDGHGDHGSAEHRGADGDRRVERNVRIITTDGHGDGDGERTRIIERHGSGDHMMVMSDRDCQNANRSEVNEGDDSNRTRIIVCTRNANGAGGNPAQQAEALRRARDRLAGDSEIPADQRQRVLAAIDREIARLRGQ